MDNKWLSALLLLTIQTASAKDNDDPFMWLEDVQGDKSMEWVKTQNAISEGELSQSKFYKDLHAQTLEIINSKDKIKYATIRGNKVYNFWRDDKNIRGLYREATLNDYLANKPQWEVVLDIDKLGKDEGESWVFKGMSCLFPDHEKCLVFLSRGGADAKVIREYNLTKREFVTDGFRLPEAKSRVSWKDENTLYVGTDFGDGSLTKSGYPRITKLWKRGTPLEQAPLVRNLQ